MKPIVLKPKRLGSAVYILPNLLTTGNLFFGFYSIVKTLDGKFTLAALAVLMAAVFDLLDGRVARLTKGTSNFGVQYDSLCDLVSFGLAPAFLMYQYGLNSLGRFGWIACFLFLACGALRLARFNVQSAIGKTSGDFIGLPIPMAAGLIVCFVAVVENLAESPEIGFWSIQFLQDIATSRPVKVGFLVVAAPLIALAMVSNVTYRSHKAIRIKGIKPFRLLVVLVSVTAFIALQPELLGFLIFLTYALSGPFEWFIGWKKAEDEQEIFAFPGEDESVIDEPPHEQGGLEDYGEHKESEETPFKD